MTTTFRRDAPASWVDGVKRSKRVAVRPTGLVAGALLGGAVLAGVGVAGWGITELSILWGVAALVALAGVVVLTLRGFPLFAMLTIVAGAVAWGAATRGRLPDSWFDILGVLGFIGVNLAFVVPLAGSFLSALLLDARRVSRLSIDEAVSGRRWWGKPDDHLPRLKELEAIPSARFFALGEGGCTHLVAAGRRVALFLPTVWPHGEFTMDAAGQVLRGGRLFVPGSEDVDGLAAEVHTWREQLAKVGGSVRGYLVVAPSRGDVSEDLVISVAPGEHLHLVHAHEMVDAAGRWLSEEPYRVDLHVMERLLVLAAGNELPEPLSLPRTFAREAEEASAERSTSPTDAAFAAAASAPAASAPSGGVAAGGPPSVLGGVAADAGGTTTAWRPGSGAMRAKLGRLARVGAARADAHETAAHETAAHETAAHETAAHETAAHETDTQETDTQEPAGRHGTTEHEAATDRPAAGVADSAGAGSSLADAGDGDRRGPGAGDRGDSGGRDSGFGSTLGLGRGGGAGGAFGSGEDADLGGPLFDHDDDLGGRARLDRMSDDGTASGSGDGSRSAAESRTGRDGDGRSRFERELDRIDRDSGASARRGSDLGDESLTRPSGERNDHEQAGESSASWEARATRELVGDWDNDSASRIAAWAAEGATDSESRSGVRRSWSPMGGETPGPDDRFQWSSEADDASAQHEAGGWPGSPGSAPSPNTESDRMGADSWNGSSRGGSAPAGESWRDRRAAEPAAESWTDRRQPEPVADSWSQRRAPEPVADSWTDRRQPEPVADSWSQRRAPEPVADSWAEQRAPEPVNGSWTDRRQPEPVADSWSDRRAPEPVAESWSQRRAAEPAADSWRDGRASEHGRASERGWSGEEQRSAVEWPPPAENGARAERPSVEWRSAGEPGPGVPQAGASRASADWRNGAEAGPSERPSVEWRAGSGSGPAERPSVEWRSGASAEGSSAGPSERGAGEGDGPSAGERRRGERGVFGGSLFDGDAPELVAQPLELRRNWDSDPAARSIRRRDRGQHGDGSEAERGDEAGARDWRAGDGGDARDWRAGDGGEARDWRAGEGEARDWRAGEDAGAQDRWAGDVAGERDWRGDAGGSAAGDVGGFSGAGVPVAGGRPADLGAGGSWTSQAEPAAGPGRGWADAPGVADAGGYRGWGEAGAVPAAQDWDQRGGQSPASGSGGGDQRDAGPVAGRGRVEMSGGAVSGRPSWGEQGDGGPVAGSGRAEVPGGRGDGSGAGWAGYADSAPPPPPVTGAGPGWGHHDAGAPVAGNAPGAPGWGDRGDSGPAAGRGRADQPGTAPSWGQGAAGQAPAGPAPTAQGPAGAAEDAWWAAGPAGGAGDGQEKGKKSRWGRNKDKDAAPAARDESDDWAAEATTRWDRSAAKSEERPARQDDWRNDDRRIEREPARRNDDAAGWGNGPRGEAIPEQRKREIGAFEDLAPLELNLDEEPKEKTSRRFLRRK
ncbi:hypothetical protein [Dactylosporangium matsuzakiense]|uniref:Uncharacterized protein n=1 Tax=Dactylosporangium matsuzakiense TaxID=53360 RepID=A0A9W6KSB2_9ACTN|nr:hypothetical protein [Dactylosporangium matsuzakiense]UWZ46260.1 hypothetical protein Dmats_07400 [Dactylosporangium matsuzakiense]GLL06240.1 hypothetical protein GCM10017581_079880 [Dactylosporangium matsuzakiense]